MSIFVSILSFASPLFQLEAKFSILIASIISAAAGYIFLNYLSKKQSPVKIEQTEKSEKYLGKEKLEVSL
jgi:NhaA family Na+:H+ antiporter